MSAARRAARHFGCSRFLQGYARGKAEWDPAYAEVARLLQGSPRPLLDVGCGIGLLAAFLRECGCTQEIAGIEPDAAKVAIAIERVQAAYAGVRFEVGDARLLPEFSGDVVVLDVLHYMDAGSQQQVLRDLAARVAPCGQLLLRTTLRDHSWRYYATLLEEGWVRLSGWIRGGRCHFPSRDEVVGAFSPESWTVSVKPMWGRTPFNSHLVRAVRKV